MNIALVDADRDLVEIMTGWLRTRGHTVHVGWSVDHLRLLWREREPDLVILDIGLLSADDLLAICRELRTRHDAFVLALTAEWDPNREAIWLESGADAVLAKPFLPKQLRAHMHALGRRMRSTLTRQPSTLLVAGSIHFDFVRHEATVNGRMVRLTPIESRILQLLMVNVGVTCTVSQIVAHAWGYSDEWATSLVKAHIRNLRGKLEPDPHRPRYLRTVTGVGYLLAAPTSSDTDNTAEGSENIAHMVGRRPTPRALGADATERVALLNHRRDDGSDGESDQTREMDKHVAVDSADSIGALLHGLGEPAGAGAVDEAGSDDLLA